MAGTKPSPTIPPNPAATADWTNRLCQEAPKSPYKSLKSAHVHTLRPQSIAKGTNRAETVARGPGQREIVRICGASDRCVHPRRPPWVRRVRRVFPARLWQGTRTNLHQRGSTTAQTGNNRDAAAAAAATIVAFLATFHAVKSS
jgi:hypothetical protein